MDKLDLINSIDDKRNVLEILDQNSNYRNVYKRNREKSSHSKHRKSLDMNSVELDSSTEEEVTESIASDESFYLKNSSNSDEESSFHSDHSESMANKNKRKKRKSSKEKKAKKRKISKSKFGKSPNLKSRYIEVLYGVRQKLFQMNAELADLSKSTQILDHDIKLYQQSSGAPARSSYTMENLPTFPIAMNVNEFGSGELFVTVPVKTVREVNDLDTILKDKIAFQNVVSVVVVLLLLFCTVHY